MERLLCHNIIPRCSTSTHIDPLEEQNPIITSGQQNICLISSYTVQPILDSVMDTPNPDTPRPGAAVTETATLDTATTPDALEPDTGAPGSLAGEPLGRGTAIPGAPAPEATVLGLVAADMQTPKSPATQVQITNKLEGSALEIMSAARLAETPAITSLPPSKVALATLSPEALPTNMTNEPRLEAVTQVSPNNDATPGDPECETLSSKHLPSEASSPATILASDLRPETPTSVSLPASELAEAIKSETPADNEDVQQQESAAGVENSNPFKCTECTKSFRIRSLLAKHLEYHVAGTPYKCNHRYCPHSFKTKGQLRRHKQTYHLKYRFMCHELCGKGFATELKRSAHYKQEHPVRTEKVWVDPGVRGLNKCSFCGLLFDTPAELSSHMMSHPEHKPHRCTYKYCTKGYSSLYALQKHEADHSSVLRYMCPTLCGKGFAKREPLEEHCTKNHEKKLGVLERELFFKKDAGDLAGYYDAVEKSQGFDIGEDSHGTDPHVPFDQLPMIFNQEPFINSEEEGGAVENSCDTFSEAHLSDAGAASPMHNSERGDEGHEEISLSSSESSMSLDAEPEVTLYMCSDDECGETYESVSELKQHRVTYHGEVLPGVYGRDDINMARRPKASAPCTSELDVSPDDKNRSEKTLQPNSQYFDLRSLGASHSQLTDNVPRRTRGRPPKSPGDTNLKTVYLKKKRGRPSVKSDKYPGNNYVEDLQCWICEAVLTSPSVLKVHMSTCHPQHGARPFHCTYQYCSNTYNNPYTLKYHMKNHGQHLKFMCPNLCGRGFPSEHLLDAHCKKMHHKKIKLPEQFQSRSFDYIDLTQSSKNNGQNQSLYHSSGVPHHPNSSKSDMDQDCAQTVSWGDSDSSAKTSSIPIHVKQLDPLGVNTAKRMENYKFPVVPQAPNISEPKGTIYVCSEPGCMEDFKCKSMLLLHRLSLHPEMSTSAQSSGSSAPGNTAGGPPNVTPDPGQTAESSTMLEAWHTTNTSETSGQTPACSQCHSGSETQVVKRKVGRPKKKRDAPELPKHGKRKVGRPKKSEAAEQLPVEKLKRKVGRPKRSETPVQLPTCPKRKVGRPKRSETAAVAPAPKKKMGRPRKKLDSSNIDHVDQTKKLNPKQGGQAKAVAKSAKVEDFKTVHAVDDQTYISSILGCWDVTDNCHSSTDSDCSFDVNSL